MRFPLAPADVPRQSDAVRALRWLAPVAVLGIVTTSALAYAGGLPSVFSHVRHADKGLHFLLVGSLALWFVAWFGDRRWTRLRLPLAVLLPGTLASVEEVAQHLSPRRTPDWGDWLADVLGLVAFWLVARLLFKGEQPSNDLA